MTNSAEPALPEPRKIVPICAIGASAGGVPALQNLFRHLPVDLGLAYVVILHLSPDYPSALSDILGSCTRMSVLQVEDGPMLTPNCVYVIPPDRELMIEDDHIVTRPFKEPRGQRAPIDMFFRSIAAARGDGIAVVLSGAGADGALGVRAVKEAGGVVMVQEPAEAGFPSMPENAIAAGVADFVAPLLRLAERVAEVARSKEAVRSLDMDGSANDLRRIVAFLRARTGHDFASYKRATVMRRVTRRMQVCRTNTLQAYADYLMTTPEEAQELLSDLLISVTMFFRDQHAFDLLAQKAIKPLFDDLDPDGDDGIRIWAVGCATGEEAYSLAILIHEEAARRKLHPKVQIFASDLDDGALATAREGRYPRSIEADVSEDRLARFFTDEGTHYRVRKEVRESVLFSKHSVIKDPPFMRLDLIACRNLLIYLERAMQQQLHAVFHYCLKPGRYLFLGSAETADSAAELFAPLDRDARIYCARQQATQLLPVMPFATPERLVIPTTTAPARIDNNNLSAALHLSALEQIAPPTALVDDMQNVLHLSPSAGRFILHSGGSMSNSLPAIVRPELRLDLRLALARALDQKQPTLTHPTLVAFDAETRRVAIHVAPVPAEANMGAQALVSFLEGAAVSEGEAIDIAPDAGPDEVRRLHAELKLAQEALVASRNSQEVAVQDLRASNEELQSINEEYRSTAEELETSKEELQSINEELHTVNAELKSKLASISVAHSDLQNLTTATDIGALFLDTDLHIKMFTPPVADLFNITRADIGRAITDFRHSLEYENLEHDAQQVLKNLTPLEREIRSRGGQWFVMRLRPYRTIEDRIDGTVVTFVDVTALKNAELALRHSEERFRSLVLASNNTFYRMSADWRLMYRLDSDKLAGTSEPISNWEDKYILADDRAQVEVAINKAIRARAPFELEHRVLLADGTIGWVLSRAVPLIGSDGQIIEWSGAASDVTERRRAVEALRTSEKRYRNLFETMDEGYLIADVIFDENGRAVDIEYVQSNPAATRMVGSDLSGHRLREINPPYEEYWYEIWGAVALTGKAERLERYATPEGIWYEFHVFKVEPDNEQSRRVAVIFKDVTDRRHAEDALRESEARYQALFATSPIPIMVLAPNAPDFTITGANAAYFAATLTSPETLIGRKLFEVFTDDPSRSGPLGSEALAVSLNRVLATRRTDAMERVRYDILTPRGTFEPHWWLAINAPMLDDNGKITAIIHQVDRQTELHLAEEAERRAQGALRESEERFQQFAKASAAALWIRDADTLAMEYVSPAIGAIYGVEEDAFLGDVKHWAALILPEDRDLALDHLRQAKAGDVVVHEFRILRSSDNVFRWIRNTDFPLWDSGRVARIGGIAEDVTEAKMAVEHQGVLLAELQHRVRNIMAMIRSTAVRSAVGAAGVEDYKTSLAGRLLALARVQTLLTQQANAGASLRSVLESEIGAQAHSENQYELTGPEVLLSPKAVEVLTLAFHELATNALKYGALSIGGGKVSVTWKTFEKREKPWLAIDWVEEGAPPRAPPTRRGFGSELIEAKIPYELRGTGRTTIEAGGARCHIEFPLRDAESILETDAPAPTRLYGGTVDMTGAPDLTGKTILVVEDDYYVASDTAAALRGAGATVLGPCPTEEAALQLLENETPTAVVLDLNLGVGGPRFEIARLLVERGIPFLFLTGYDPDVIPQDLNAIERLQKPIALRDVVEAVGRL